MSTTAGVDGPGTAGPAGTRLGDAVTPGTGRSLVWQRLHNRVKLSSGETVTRELVERLTDEEVQAMEQAMEQARGDGLAYGRRDDAARCCPGTAVADEYQDLPTLPAYERMP